MPKTILGTSEKSNFILNMSKNTVRKWVCGLLCVCVAAPLAGGAAALFASGASPLTAAFLYAAGFSCLLFYIVLLLRKDIAFGENKGVFFALGLAVLSLVSYIGTAVRNSEYPDAVETALFGEAGRHEGLLALLAYFGIFLLASAAFKRSTVKLVFDMIIGSALIQGVAAVFQHIPCGFPSYFRDLPSLLLLNGVNLSSGFSESPIFYGSFLTLAMGVGIVGAMYEENILRARIYGFTAVFCFTTGLFTSSVVPLIGAGAAAVTAGVCLFTAGKGGTEFKNGVLRSPRKRFAAVLLTMAAVLGIVALTQGIWLRDKAIAYTDGFNRLFIVTQPSPVHYDSLWKIGAERSFIMIKDQPLLGIGPDLMAKYQMTDELMVDAVDRSYNEYLYIAATRGIPALVVYLGLLAATVRKLVKRMPEFSKNKENWFVPALLTAAGAYCVQGFFSASAVTVAPLFWLLLGMAWSDFKQDK